MSYLARVKARLSQTPPPDEPSKPSKAPSEGFKGSPPGRICENTWRVDALAGLAASPLDNVDAVAWRDRLIGAADFERTWGSQARALGWTDGELYSLHPLAPMTRLDAMGVAFCTLGRTVLEVTPDAVVMAAPPAGRIQRAYKPRFVAPPAWKTFAKQYARAMPF